jgi:hypothetical protein
VSCCALLLQAKNVTAGASPAVHVAATQNLGTKADDVKTRFIAARCGRA